MTIPGSTSPGELGIIQRNKVEFLLGDPPPVETFSNIGASPEHPTYTADKAVAVPLARGQSALVAALDGVGMGNENSAKAAELTQTNLLKIDSNLPGVPPSIKYGVSLLKNAIFASRNEIKQLQLSTGDPNVDTTVSAGIVCVESHGRKFLVTANVGDSSLFTFEPVGDASGVVKRTDDHSLVNAFVKQGILSSEEAFYDERRNQIFRTVGSLDSPKQIDITVIEIPSEKSTVVLALSDGVTDNIHPNALPIAINQDYKASFDGRKKHYDLKAFARHLDERALHIMEGNAKQAKKDDRCVAGVKIPVEAQIYRHAH